MSSLNSLNSSMKLKNVLFSSLSWSISKPFSLGAISIELMDKAGVLIFHNVYTFLARQSMWTYFISSASGVNTKGWARAQNKHDWLGPEIRYCMSLLKSGGCMLARGTRNMCRMCILAQVWKLGRAWAKLTRIGQGTGYKIWARW